MTQDEPFVNFALMNEVQKAYDDGIIHLNVPLNGEYEENHLSELERRLRPLDEVENYVAITTLIKYHRNLLVKILEYMNKEGEEHDNNRRD